MDCQRNLVINFKTIKMKKNKQVSLDLVTKVAAHFCGVNEDSIDSK
jgi:hypothetical protein